MPPFSNSGYSGTPLIKTLGITDGTRLLPLGAPPEYLVLLGRLPAGVVLSTRTTSTVDIVHFFTVRRAELTKRLTELRSSLRANAVVWVSWPKRAAQLPTDITEDVIREVALPLGFVDVKVCAVSAIGSGLKLVVRKELR